MLSEVPLQKSRIRATCSIVLIFVDFGAVQAVEGEQHIPIHFSRIHPILWRTSRYVLIKVLQNSVSQIRQTQSHLFVLMHDHMFRSAQTIINPLLQKRSK
jgi:hypothetical protein